MPETLGSAPLLTPWFGMWDFWQNSSEYNILLALGLFTIALGGIVLAFYGGQFREQPARQQTLAVHVPRPIRRKQHRRR